MIRKLLLHPRFLLTPSLCSAFTLKGLSKAPGDPLHDWVVLCAVVGVLCRNLQYNRINIFTVLMRSELHPYGVGGILGNYDHSNVRPSFQPVESSLNIFHRCVLVDREEIRLGVYTLFADSGQ